MTIEEIVKKELEKARVDLYTLERTLNESVDGHEQIKIYQAIVKINKIIKGAR